jgi:hypothetical protein
MLDSLVRVSRRVGRVTDADAADADTSNVSSATSKSARFAGTCEQRPNVIDRLSIAETSVYADVSHLIGARYMMRGPAVNQTIGLVASLFRDSTSIESLRRPFVSVAALTIEKCAARLLLTTRRLDSRSSTGRAFADRTTDSRRLLTAPSVFF